MRITFDLLHTAKRERRLPALLASLTPAQRVEAAQVCAANKRGTTVSHWLSIFGALMEAEGVAALDARAVEIDETARVAA